MDEDEGDERQLVENDDDQVITAPTRTYKRRWYVLILFSLLCCLQVAVWNTFGPIEKSVRYAYPDWTETTVALMADWGTIVFVVLSAPVCWLLEKYGLKPVALISSGITAVGSVLRVLSTDSTTFLVTAHVAAIMNGVTGIVAMAVPAALSAAWFPPSQRTTATTISQAMYVLGNGVSFVVGPLLVPDDFLNRNGSGTISPPEEVRNQIWWYMLVDASAAVAIFTSMAIFFPSKPDLPPSHSASNRRIVDGSSTPNFAGELKTLVGNRSVILCAVAYSLTNGVVGAWASVMTLNLDSSINVSDKQSGYIGLTSTVASVTLSLTVAKLMDHPVMRRRVKMTLVVLAFLATGCFGWLVLIVQRVVELRMWQLYLVVVGGNSIVFTTAPLFFEYVNELAFPVSESLVGGFLSTGNNFVGLVFLSIFFIPHSNYVWINYVLVGCTFVMCPLVLFTKERYARLTLDE